MQIEKSKIGRVGCQTWEGLMLLFKSEGHLLAQFPLAWERNLLFYSKWSFNWLYEAHLHDGGWYCYTKSTDLMLIASQKHPYRYILKIFDCISGHCSPAKFWYVKLTVTSVDSLWENGPKDEWGKGEWNREGDLAQRGIHPTGYRDPASGTFGKRRHFHCLLPLTGCPLGVHSLMKSWEPPEVALGMQAIAG